MRRTWLIGLLGIVACSHSATPLPRAVQAVVDAAAQARWMANGTDPWEVFVCHVPTDTRSVTYAGLPLRLPIRPEALSAILDAQVGAYFATLSHGSYHPRFMAGGEVTISATDEPQVCVDLALAAASRQVHGVLVVADAEHNATQPGGFANPGSACAAPPCTATASRRSVYVGGSDFSAEWGDRPPMDLIEHELGHALGWPHSGYDESFSEPHRSALDVMSNSASPRQVRPDRRDAPDTLAINRLAAGWLPTSDVAVVPAAGAVVTLSPSAGTSGTRLAVVELDGHTFVTVELLTADGFDDHLPASGIAVHVIEGDDNTRTQTPLVGLAPYDRLLTPGETLTSHEWSFAVGDGWRVTIHRVSGGPTVTS